MQTFALSKRMRRFMFTAEVLMNSSTKTRALRAAAKLAVGVSFGACGGAEMTALSPDAGGYDAKQSLDASADNFSVLTDGAVADSNVLLADGGWCTLTKMDGGLTDDAVNCCLQLTTDNTPPDAGWSFDAGAFKSDPSLKGCCQALYETGGSNMVNYVYGPKKWGANTCQACADAIGQPSACTPWGPAVPPAMLEIV